jgi:hypothetical protein
VIGDHVAADVQGQLGFGAEVDLGADPEQVTSSLVGELIGGHVEAGADQRMSAAGGVGAVDRVHAVGDAPGASHVLALDTGGGLARFLLP